jgi:hypothetical protein
MNQSDMTKAFETARERNRPSYPKGVGVRKVQGGPVGKLYLFDRTLPLDVSNEDGADWAGECAKELAALEATAVQSFLSQLAHRVKETAGLVEALREQRADREAIKLAEDNAERASKELARAIDLELVSRPPVTIQRVTTENNTSFWKCSGRVGVRVKR